MDITYSGMSDFQHISVITNGGQEHQLLLDGVFQTSMPNDDYARTMLGPNFGMATVILGGGDMCHVPEMLRRGIPKWRQYEIDQHVVEVCGRFCDVPQGKWRNNVIIADAFEMLRTGEAAAEHIAVDLLAMTRLSTLSEITTSEFLNLLCANASKLISGYATSGTAGILCCEVLRREFYSRGWKYFVTLMDSERNAHFCVGKELFVLPSELQASIVTYKVYPKDARIMEESLENIMVILSEAC